MALSNPPKKQEIIDLINTKLATGSTITADEHREIELALITSIFDGISKIGDIKEIAVDNFNDFDTSGSTIGRGKVGTMRYGWAICNGYNGTVDKCGRVTTGINTAAAGGNSTKPLWNKDIRFTDGYETVTLAKNEMPAHTHSVTMADVWTRSTNADGDNSSPGANKTYTTTSIGGNAAHNNMQPYVVSVFVQKISENY